MSSNNDFYTAKEKLGLLSFGDPGTGDKVQVNDTYLISAARKIDSKIKQHPELKKKLVKARGLARGMKSRLKKANFRTENSELALQPVDNLKIAQRIKQVSFGQSNPPVVSIVIPAFNKIEMTTSCLESLTKLSYDELPFQVILVDNGSTDNTSSMRSIEGLTYVKNEENLGFVGGCNSALPHINGEYTVFLNNDAEVADNWLSALYETINQDQSVGIVGSKIIYPNGTLQEAGGVVFTDGTGLNYGKFDSAESYQYEYRREVDYCSGASIIIRTALLNEMGGFDTLYHPAYYEDTDLCFKVRDKGLKVIYQPHSVIYHIEGGTAGTNPNSGYKKFQEINRDKFLRRWDKTLKSSHVKPDRAYAGRDRSGDKLALIIEESLPSPDKDSGSVRMMAVIKSLQSLGYKVTFWPNDLKATQPYASNMQEMGVEVVYGNVDFLQFAKNYAHFYDVVMMSRPEVCARYINVCRSLFTKAKLIYDTVDLHYVRLARQAEIETANAEALLEQSKWYKILETGLMERTDATIVVSPIEVEILKEDEIKANIGIVSNIHTINDDAYTVGYSKREGIVFVGNYAHLPNRDSVIWLDQEIMPEILKRNSGLTLHIVGANMPDDLKRKIQGKNTMIHGFLSDEALAALLKRTRLFVAPLRYGAGVKGKVGQAIEFGIPTVTTPVAAEGMFVSDGHNGMVAETAEQFAQKVIDLYENKKLWETIQMNEKDIVLDHFSPKRATDNLAKLLK
ncbi:MAG: glycosyltransferase [Patescibacteria group bacterium]